MSGTSGLSTHSPGSSRTRYGRYLRPTRRWPRPAVDPAGLRVLTVWGRTLAGRGLIVAVYHSSGHIWKIIGAREMRTDELAEFAKWEERR